MKPHAVRLYVLLLSKKKKCTYFSLQTIQSLLVVVQKYYLPRGVEYLATPLRAEGSTSAPKPPLASGGCGFSTRLQPSNGEMLDAFNRSFVSILRLVIFSQKFAFLTSQAQLTGHKHGKETVL